MPLYFVSRQIYWPYNARAVEVAAERNVRVPMQEAP